MSSSPSSSKIFRLREAVLFSGSYRFLIGQHQPQAGLKEEEAKNADRAPLFEPMFIGQGRHSRKAFQG